MTRPHTPQCKLCDLADFRDPELRSLIRAVFNTERLRTAGRSWYRTFPKGSENRRHWEAAMALLTFDSLGLFRDEKQILAIGPGNEAMVHWLTNRMGRVVATHLRLEAGAWIESPFGGEILVDAERQWPWRWRPGRLVVEPMDARDLRVEDRTVDAVVCSNLIEHYSEPADARRVIEEIFRVLRFGGVAALALPFRLQGPAPGPPGVRLFDESELRTLMLDELTWAMTTALNTDLSRDTLRSETTVDDTSENAPAGPSQSVQKQVLLRQGEHLWTSAHVALVKPVPIR